MTNQHANDGNESDDLCKPPEGEENVQEHGCGIRQARGPTQTKIEEVRRGSIEQRLLSRLSSLPVKGTTPGQACGVMAGLSRKVLPGPDATLPGEIGSRARQCDRVTRAQKVRRGSYVEQAGGELAMN